MKITTLFILAAIPAVFFAACEVPAGNPPANNANTTAVKPVAATPTADALLALDKQANEAYFNGDAKFFEGMLSDEFVTLGPGGSRMNKAATIRMIAGLKCDIKDDWQLDEQHVATIDADTYVLSYKGTFDGTCTMDGKSEKVPSPVRAATVWVRSGDKWLAAYHGENLIFDPKNPPPARAKADINSEEPKKEHNAAANSNKASYNPAPAKVTGDKNTDTLVKVELAVWAAWKALDAKKLEELTTKDLSFIDIFGNHFATKADTIKTWSEGRCDVKSVSVADGFASAISPTVEILTHKGTAEGTCDGQKLGGLIYGTGVYVKNGDAWKLAFTLNSPD